MAALNAGFKKLVLLGLHGPLSTIMQVVVGEHAVHAEGKSDDGQSQWYCLGFIRGLTVIELRLTVTKTGLRMFQKDLPLDPKVWHRRLDHVAKCLDQYIQWNMFVPEEEPGTAKQARKEHCPRTRIPASVSKLVSSRSTCVPMAPSTRGRRRPCWPWHAA